MTTPSSDNLLLGRGAVYFDIYENGSRTGEFHLGNVSSFGLSIEQETREKKESMTRASATYKSTPISTSATLNLTGDEFTLDNLALTSLGVQSTLTQSAGTVANEAVTAAAKAGRFYPLAFRKVADVVISDATKTYAAGTDYTVDAATGRIYIVPTGTAVGKQLKAAYSYETVSLQVVEAGKVGLIEAFVRFIGDPAAGPAFEVQVFKVQVSPSGELGFITDDYGNWTLTGKVLAAGPAGTFYKVIKL